MPVAGIQPPPVTSVTPTDAPQSPATPLPVTPVTQTVPISFEEYTRLQERDRIATEAENARRVSAQQAEDARLALVARDQGAAAALEQQRQAHIRDLAERDNARTQLLQQIATSRLDSAVTEILGGVTFVGADEAGRAYTARLVSADIRSRLESVQDATGQFVVREKGTLRPYAEAIREALAAPHLQQLIAPRNPPPASTVAPSGGMPVGGYPTPGHNGQPSWLEQNAAAFNAQLSANGSFGLRMQ